MLYFKSSILNDLSIPQPNALTRSSNLSDVTVPPFFSVFITLPKIGSTA
nr:MAG TPA: hypothetical protein [Caudoviricetes sp.]